MHRSQYYHLPMIFFEYVSDRGVGTLGASQFLVGASAPVAPPLYMTPDNNFIRPLKTLQNRITKIINYISYFISFATVFYLHVTCCLENPIWQLASCFSRVECPVSEQPAPPRASATATHSSVALLGDKTVSASCHGEFPLHTRKMVN